jgi:hypothetical protein
MRQKLITLCPNSFEIAQKKENFSQWVRNKLLEEKPNTEGSSCKFRYKCPLCKIDPLFTTRRPRKCISCDYPMKFEGQVVE